MMLEILKKNNIKLTKQRELVFNSIKGLDTKATIKEIQNKCGDKVDSSTIYRIIALLIDKKILIKNLDSNGIVYYTINDSKHIHYIECTQCHKKTKIDYCPVKEIEKQVCSETGYILISHTIKLDGICEKCEKSIKSNQIYS